VRCHRDLHPGNVVVDGSGELVVLDQDDLGPADPARELARAMFDWWSDPGPSLGAMRAMYDAYIAAGGPARVRGAADLTMLVATRLNFLLGQLRISTDAGSAPADRAWADQEIDESLRILPTTAQVADVLDALGPH
jgi:aminoglycoside phosphotransferase (APT) family kinase protein